jgi:hypothetical protein
MGLGVCLYVCVLIQEKLAQHREATPDDQQLLSTSASEPKRFRASDFISHPAHHVSFADSVQFQTNGTSSAGQWGCEPTLAD